MHHQRLHQHLAFESRFASLIGFKSWASNTPCPSCNIRKEALFDFSECHFGSLLASWVEFSSDKWHEEIDAHLIKVTLNTAAMYEQLKTAICLMYFDKRPFPGRLVTKRSDRFGFEIHDRLHPSGAVDELSSFDEIRHFPADVFFYRSKGSHINFVTPLITHDSLHVGITGLGMEHMCYDTLHTMDLGVTQIIAGFALHYLVGDAADVFNTGSVFK